MYNTGNALVPAGSVLVFDFLDAATFCSETAAPRVTEMVRMAEYAAEPILTGFDPAKLAAELAEVGWRLQETVSPAEIQRRYFSAHRQLLRMRACPFCLGSRWVIPNTIAHSIHSSEVNRASYLHFNS